MASFKGRVKLSADEIKKILSTELEHLYGIKIAPEKVWLGLVQAGEPGVEAIIDLDEATFTPRG